MSEIELEVNHSKCELILSREEAQRVDIADKLQNILASVLTSDKHTVLGAQLTAAASEPMMLEKRKRPKWMRNRLEHLEAHASSFNPGAAFGFTSRSTF